MDILWSSIRLKYEEAEYFLKQLIAHSREPRVFYYYLSAYITSTRSLTFHLQKKAKGLKKTEIYRKVCNELLSDTEGNSLEKEGYPKLIYRQQTGIKPPEKDQLVWYANNGGTIDPSNETNPFEKVYKLIDEEWNLSHQFGTESEEYEYQFRWVFLGHPQGHLPDGSIDAIMACERYLKKLWHFLIEIRRQFEKVNNEYLD